MFPMKVQGATVFLTGGAGFVGSHIVDKLLKERVKKIIILDNFLRGTPYNLSHLGREKRITLVNGDIRETALIYKLTRGVDYVIHQAAIRLLTCIENPRLCHEVMVDGTFNILEAAVKHKVKKVIMASSVSVYGEPSYVPIDEKHPYNNTTVYGAAKIANEHLAKAFHSMYNIPIVLLRYFNVYGPRMDILGAYTEVLIKWLERLEKGEPPILHGDGKQALDFVYVEDVALANIHALKSDVNWGIYNVGTGKSTSLKNLAILLIKITGAKVKPVFQSDVKRPYVQERQADIQKAKKELGFVAATPIDDGLRKLIEWRKQRLTQTKNKASLFSNKNEKKYS